MPRLSPMTGRSPNRQPVLGTLSNLIGACFTRIARCWPSLVRSQQSVSAYQRFSRVNRSRERRRERWATRC